MPQEKLVAEDIGVNAPTAMPTIPLDRLPKLDTNTTRAIPHKL
jgi:hypothetical protein